jgi:hypothetical protein
MSPYDFHAERLKYASELLTAGRKIIDSRHNQFPGAVSLYKEQHELAKTGAGKTEFINRFDTLSEEEKSAFLRFSEFDWLADTASWKKAIINRPDDRENNPYHLTSIIQSLKAAGQPRDYVEKVCHHILIGCSATHHPTGYLDEAQDLETQEDGVDRYLGLVTNESPENAAAAVLDMDSRLTPANRATTLGEIASASRYVLRAINARNVVLNQIIESVDAVYGPRTHHTQSPDFSRKALEMDLAVRLWADYDGKANAEYWTLLAEEATTTYLSLSHHIWRLEQASAAIENLNHPRNEASVPALSALAPDDTKIHTEMRPLYNLMGEIRKDLKILLDEMTQHHRELNDKNITPEQRAEVFKAKEPVFNEMLKRMGSLYNDRQFHGRTIKNDRGLSVYNGITREFTRLREHAAALDWNPVATDHIINSRRDLHADGLTIFRMEPRHNHLMNEKIINNLFRHPEFLEYLKTHKIISASQIQSIEKANSKKGFSSFSFSKKASIVKKIEDTMAINGTLGKFLLAANPLKFDSNGYPEQTYGALRRMEVMEQYQLKYGPLFVVAESDDFGERLQRFLMSPYHLNHLVPTALTEDMPNMMRAHQHREQNHINGGQDFLKLIKSSKVPAQFKRALNAVMLARSDISKDFGPLANVLVSAVTALIADGAAARQSPDIIKWGGGQSNNRGGGDFMEVLRIVAQRLQEWQRQNKQKLPPEIRAMVTSLMSTIQGRALYKSGAEIAHELKDQMSEMIGLWTELDGLVKEGTFIPQNDITNPDANDFLEYATEVMMTRYKDFRFAEGKEKGDIILDALALEISNPDIAAHGNNAARINARGGDKINRQTKQRAIGNDIWTALSRTHHNGYFTVGDFFELLHTAHHKGIKIKNKDGTQRTIKLSDEALRQILSSDKINYNVFVRSLSGAAQADFEHGLKRLGVLNQYSHQQIMDIAAGCSTNKGGKFIQKGAAKGIDSKIAYFATIYANAHKLRAFTDAIADDSFKTQPDMIELMQSHPPGDNPLRLAFKSASKKGWPFIERTQDYARRAIPAFLITDYYQNKINEAKAGNGKMPSEERLREAASFQRAGGMATVGHVIFSYENAYGRRKEALPENPADIIANDNLVLTREVA